MVPVIRHYLDGLLIKSRPEGRDGYVILHGPQGTHCFEFRPEDFAIIYDVLL